jgi:hypothetical protein
MSDSKRQVVYAAAYADVAQALAALNAIEQLHKDEDPHHPRGLRLRDPAAQGAP